MSLFKRILPARNLNAPVETRLFEISLFITVIIFYLWTGLGLWFGYEWPILGVYSSGSLVYTALYWAYKKGVSLRVISLLYYLLIFVILGIAWLPSGGLKGAITYFIVLVYLSGLLILDPRDFRLFILVSIGMVLVFTIYEFYVPNAAAPYTSDRGLLRDLAIANVTMLSVMALAMYIFKRAYSRDRVKLKRVNHSLEFEKQNVERANKAKTTFLANISHEMRTPLNGIVGTAELLRQTKLTNEQSDLVRDLVYSSDILRGLISNVLDISMIEEGKMVLMNTQFDYYKVISEVGQFFAPVMADKKGLELKLDQDFSIPVKLLGDPARLRQVVINLVSNAIKFTEEGYVKVTTKLLSKDASRVIIKTTVEDTGKGISQEHQEFIFDEFHRDEKVYGIEGTGLGLSICKKIVTSMGGLLTLDKSDESGSIFSFVIQMKVNQGDDREVAIAVNKEQKTDYGALKVLIAEDQPINQMVLTKMLKNLGVATIDLAEDGQKAVDVALEGDYDFILMDIRMPVKDGIQAANEILSNYSGAKAPVIISITANALKADQDACFAVGIKDFISKPFNVSDLQSTLEKYT